MRESSSHAEGGGGGWVEVGTNSFEVVSMRDTLAILKGVCKMFPPLRGGGQKVLPCLEGDKGANRFRAAMFPFCSPPPRN